MKFEPVIGIEIHAQLNTQSKIFSSAPTQFGAKANTQACVIDLGLPGTLPVLNKEAVIQAIKFGVAINAEIAEKNIFSRKNYFYPDLPKGYQISQFKHPIVGNGTLRIMLPNNQNKTIRITRAHLEEDAGKSIHDHTPGVSLIDLNRAGTPLLEIVSEPDMFSATEAICYIKTLHQLVRHLGICNGNMQEGSFRADINISLRAKGSSTLGTRTELKNLNSFRFIEQAINFEIARQEDLLNRGVDITQETRLYDPNRNVTRAMRTKEDAHDYRYFPDPDLLPVIIDQTVLDAAKKDLPELPWIKRQRYIETLQLSTDEADQLIDDVQKSRFFEETCQHNSQLPAKLVANWVLGEISALLNKHEATISNIPVTSKALCQLIERIEDQTISNSIAKKVLVDMWNSKKMPNAIIEEQGLKQINNSDDLEKIINDIIANHPDQVTEYQNGKQKLFSFFVGKVMQQTKGKANGKLLADILKNKLSK